MRVLPATPVFSLALAENQSRLVTVGMKVDISSGGGRLWQAQVSAVTAGVSEGITALLSGMNGAPICSDDCASIPYGEPILLPSSIHVVPEVEGVRVPAAAVVTGAGGHTGVVLESGEFRPVTVVAGASGMVIVEGIEAGTRVRTPGTPLSEVTQVNGRPLLATKDVTFGYSRGAPLVRDLSVEFPAGSMTALIGPSGCGKSTMLYLLGLMLQPLTGAVLLDGTAVHALPDRDRAGLRAHRFGFVFQDAALDPTRTVLDNVVETALYRGQSRRDALVAAYELMDRFGVRLRATHKPGQISGGQAQRIALCRALLAAPKVTLADEPTGNLDPATSATVVTALREHADAGAAVVIATHDPIVAAACDHRLSLGGVP